MSTNIRPCECMREITLHLHPDLADIVRAYASTWDMNEITWAYFSSINTYPMFFIHYNQHARILDIIFHNQRTTFLISDIHELVDIDTCKDKPSPLGSRMISTFREHDPIIDRIIARLGEIAADAREHCPLRCMCDPIA